MVTICKITIKQFITVLLLILIMYKEAFKCDKQVGGKIEKWCNSTMQYHFQLEVCMGWVEGIF